MTDNPTSVPKTCFVCFNFSCSKMFQVWGVACLTCLKRLSWRRRPAIEATFTIFGRPPFRAEARSNGSSRSCTMEGSGDWSVHQAIWRRIPCALNSSVGKLLASFTSFPQGRDTWQMISYLRGLQPHPAQEAPSNAWLQRSWWPTLAWNLQHLAWPVCLATWLCGYAIKAFE